jgi:hypothetical protein
VPFSVVFVVQKFNPVIFNSDYPGVVNIIVDESDVAIPFSSDLT